ncbi:MAG: cytochrome ubiquinol oxidase subunit I [Acidobacteriota bacterium]
MLSSRPWTSRIRRVPLLLLLTLGALALLVAAPAWAQEAGSFGRDTAYRTAFGMDGKWLNPRTIVWVLAQLHLLFAAFVLAVPMFAVLIEFIGIFSKDPVQAKRYDDLAHEFTRLLTTAFSATSIIGAIFTFVCLGFYPKLFNYLVEVFGPSMYMYATIFFGESFSLYLYYYGWGKFNKWLHAGLGVLLNVFGITLMLIANAWTTFMMAPAGVTETGEVVDRWAAFFNFLLHPINIHRLIANLCMGGSVAAAYAAFKFLSTKDPAQRAHYDWMGYLGNFIAVLALLPLPFAGYYLGFEIYAFNQQLGIYMMGGVLSWLFIMQAVLIGALFWAANWYLWLAMDRIDGSERYRGWIKYLLGIITLGILIWATPKTLILTSAEINQMGGTFHEVFGNFGVMSAKNTAVNFIILATFLSFLLYRRSNKKATVPWAPLGNAIQVGAFAVTSIIVLVIGIGGYIPELWLESSKRVAMSPYQVLAVLVCMVVCLAVDVPMFRGADEVGKIRWGQVSNLSQYALIFLAVTFTWTMALMGFVRSSLRQHWHVYEVMKDESAQAFTPAIGYATVIVTICVLIFFALVSVIFWITSLGTKHAEEIEQEREPLTAKPFLIGGGIAAALIAAAVGMAVFKSYENQPTVDSEPPWARRMKERRLAIKEDMASYGKTESGEAFQLPTQDAIDLVVNDPDRLDPVELVIKPWGEMSSAERGKALYNGLIPSDREADLKDRGWAACSACHSINGTKGIGPTFLKRWGKEAKIAGGEAVFDEAYVTESVREPGAKIAVGFANAMIPYAATDEEIEGIIAYLKEVK